jgi:hypothetical protein
MTGFWLIISGFRLGHPNQKLETRNSEPEGSGGFDNFAGFKATRADADARRSASDYGANGLKIWIEAAVGAVVGVTHAVTELWSLSAYITAFRHYYYPPVKI